jgi:hypothetical protein
MIVNESDISITEGSDVRMALISLSLAGTFQHLLSFCLAVAKKRWLAGSDYYDDTCDTAPSGRDQMLKMSSERYVIKNRWNHKPVHVVFVT